MTKILNAKKRNLTFYTLNDIVVKRIFSWKEIQIFFVYFDDIEKGNVTFVSTWKNWNEHVKIPKIKNDAGIILWIYLSMIHTHKKETYSHEKNRKNKTQNMADDGWCFDDGTVCVYALAVRKYDSIPFCLRWN